MKSLHWHAALLFCVVFCLLPFGQTTSSTALSDIRSTSGTLTFSTGPMLGETDLRNLPILEFQQRATITTNTVNLVDGKLVATQEGVSYPDFYTDDAVWVTSDSAARLVSHPASVHRVHRVWKNTYAAKDGKSVLERTLEAKIIPAQQETIEWPKETK